MALKDIDTLIVVMMENRSFDHAVGYLSTSASTPPMNVEGLRDDPVWLAQWTNSFLGTPFPIHKLEANNQTIDDPPHERESIAVQIDTPPYPGSSNKMGGFVTSFIERKPPPEVCDWVMGYYTQDAVPTFDFFARNFCVCDHWFSALPAGTQPNRLMAMSGKSSIANNAEVFLPDQDLVYDWLTDHKVPWCVYQSGDFFPFFSLMPKWLPEIVTSLAGSALGIKGRFRRYAQFKEHWMNSDSMPNVIYLEPEYTDGPHANPNDDHPPTGIAKGQAFLADIYATVIANPDRWQKTLMIVTYDEHGGFFDHVTPLTIPASVGGVQLKTTGVRVPAFLISPHVKAGQVFKGNLDHTSILQLLADRFNAGQTYSDAVGTRQAQLSRITDALLPSPLPNAPNVPFNISAVTALQAPAAAGETHMSISAAANSQAFHNVALKVAQDHPELLSTPAWQPLADYVSAFV